MLPNGLAATPPAREHADIQCCPSDSSNKITSRAGNRAQQLEALPPTASSKFLRNIKCDLSIGCTFIDMGETQEQYKFTPEFGVVTTSTICFPEVYSCAIESSYVILLGRLTDSVSMK